MKSKSTNVTKWIALAAVPLSLAIVLVNAAQRQREARAKAATQKLLYVWSSRTVEKLAVEDLVLQGADVRARNRDGQTALHLAARFQPSAIDVLLDHGANVNVRDNVGGSPLFYAAMMGNTESVRLLLSRGADVHARTTLGGRPLTALFMAQDELDDSLRNPLFSSFDNRVTRYRSIIKMLKAAGARE